MREDPLLRLATAFGDVLVRCRTKRNWTLDALAGASGLSRKEIRSMEAGDYGPSLLEFFRIAEALGEQPVMLLADVVAAWRDDQTDMLQCARPSDFARVMRLGYHHRPGDFRELPSVYYSLAEATHAAGRLNAQRHTRGVALLDTVCIYVRLGYVGLRPDDCQEARP